MNRVRTACGLGVLLAGLAGCSASVFHSPADRGASSESPVLTRAEAARAGLTPRWQRQVAIGGGEQVRNVWRVGDTIYATTSEHILHSINASAGTDNWYSDLGKGAIHIYRPQETPGAPYVLVMTRGQVFLLDKRTGDTFKTATLGFQATTDPVATEHTFCVGGPNRFHGLYYDPLAGEKWITAAPRDTFDATPASAGNALFIVSRAGKLWRIDANTGEPLWWDRQTSGQVSAGLSTESGRLFVACLDRNLYAFDANKGTWLWQTRLDGTLDQMPVPASGNVLCVGTGSGLYCLAAQNGDKKWFVPDVKQIISHTPERIWASDSRGNLLGISMETGAVEQTVQVRHVKQYVPNTLDGTLYIVTADGRVAAFDTQRQ